MIRKHIDIVAMAVLLSGAALYSGTREFTKTSVGRYQTVAFTRAIHNAMQCARSAQAAQGQRSAESEHAMQAHIQRRIEAQVHRAIEAQMRRAAEINRAVIAQKLQCAQQLSVSTDLN